MAALFALGLFHGVNPGMGWLLAVALGLQEGDRRALWRALVALAVGHTLAIAAASAAAVLSAGLVPGAVVRMSVAVALVALGSARLSGPRHPRAGGMRVGLAGLTGWSFLMASAHGAGLMVLPFILDEPLLADVHGQRAGHAFTGGAAWAGLAATFAHAAGYLIATAIVAWIVYDKLGVGLIRRAWINLDVIWACALIATGIIAAI